MKSIPFLVSFIAFFLSCNAKKSITDNALNPNSIEMSSYQEKPKLVYEAMSRGYFYRITIENETVSVVETREGNPVITKLDPTDAALLAALLNKISVEELPDLKAPSNKRAYDGATFATLQLILADKTYKTTDFDGGFPPQSIEKLVNKMVEIAEKGK